MPITKQRRGKTEEKITQAGGVQQPPTGTPPTSVTPPPPPPPDPVIAFKKAFPKYQTKELVSRAWHSDQVMILEKTGPKPNDLKIRGYILRDGTRARESSV